MLMLRHDASAADFAALRYATLPLMLLPFIRRSPPLFTLRYMPLIIFHALCVTRLRCAPPLRARLFRYLLLPRLLMSLYAVYDAMLVMPDALR